MSLFKFEGFVFDSARYHLSHRGKRVSVRPKALRLLKLLILERHRVVSKAEIMSEIWGTNFARDHLIFQLISELRQSPLEGECIRTQPNEGYQWNASTQVVKESSFSSKLMAASVVLGIMCLVPISSNVVEDSIDNYVQLPAYSAFSKGVLAMENGQKDQAIKWFEFSLAENPGSIESSLLLAEALYKNDKADEASALLLSLQKQTNLSAYDKLSTNQMLSHISQKQGNISDALRYAQKFSPTDVVGQCSIASVNSRIQKLQAELGLEPTNELEEPDSEPNNASPIANEAADPCEQLEHNDDMSLCLPNQNMSLYASKDNQLNKNMA